MCATIAVQEAVGQVDEVAVHVEPDGDALVLVHLVEEQGSTTVGSGGDPDRGARRWRQVLLGVGADPGDVGAPVALARQRGRRQTSGVGCRLGPFDEAGNLGDDAVVKEARTVDEALGGHDEGVEREIGERVDEDLRGSG